MRQAGQSSSVARSGIGAPQQGQADRLEGLMGESLRRQVRGLPRFPERTGAPGYESIRLFSSEGSHEVPHFVVNVSRVRDRLGDLGTQELPETSAQPM